MHIIEAIGLGDGARMSVVAKRLNITVGSLTSFIPIFSPYLIPYRFYRMITL